MANPPIVAIEPWGALRDEIPTLLQEVLHGTPSPAATYEDAHATGALVIASLRDDGQLVGAWPAFVYPHPHYPGATTVAADVLFIKPEHRSKREVVKLIEALIEEARRVKAKSIYVGSPISEDNTALLNALGFNATSIQFERAL